MTVTVVDGSDRTAFTTFSKSAFLALGGDADVGMLPIQLTLSKEANAGVVAAAGVVAHDGSSSKASSSQEASSSAKKVESQDAEVPAATSAAPVKTTAAPAASTTPAPTTSYDSASAAAASKAAGPSHPSAFSSRSSPSLTRPSFLVNSFGCRRRRCVLVQGRRQGLRCVHSLTCARAAGVG